MGDAGAVPAAFERGGLRELKLRLGFPPPSVQAEGVLLCFDRYLHNGITGRFPQ